MTQKRTLSELLAFLYSKTTGLCTENPSYYTAMLQVSDILEIIERLKELEETKDALIKSYIGKKG